MDSGRGARRGDLTALAYHRNVADWLETQEPRSWATIGASKRANPDDARRLLRSAYRLEPAGHPLVHAALARAVEAFRIDQPVSVYQIEGGGGAANAGLLTLPEGLAILLSGNLIPLLSEPGLCAVFGHELAHHLLWTIDGGRYRVADHLLDLLSVDAATPPPYLETARRYRLATELFADRGAVVACGELNTAIGALVTTVTGLADVDPVGYLAQAEAADPLSGSSAASHPETVLRAWALSRWHAELDDEELADASHDRAPAGELAARALLRPRLDLDTLDVFDRAELEGVTRSLIEDLLLDLETHTEPVLALVRQYFPDLAASSSSSSSSSPGLPSPAQNAAWGSRVNSVRALSAGTSPQTRRYLSYVLLDLATVDPDLDAERALVLASAFAERVGMGADFERVAKAELQLSAAAWARIGANGQQAVR